MIEPVLLERAYRKAKAGRWAVPMPVFQAALEAGAGRAFPGAAPARRELEAHVEALHLEDLALACACDLGHEAAWEHFVAEMRPVLYRAAAAIDRTGGARDLADGLYAELYGLRGGGTERRSLFRYFHGRSSLATWLRSVLAQRHVDRVRTDRRLEPLPDPEAIAIPAAAADPDRTRLGALVSAALAAAIALLPARERLRMRAYYEQGLTLAQVGRLTGEHEATVSRQLARTRRALREGIDRHLRRDAGLGAVDVEQCWRALIDDPGSFDLGVAFGRGGPSPAEGPPPDRPARPPADEPRRRPEPAE
jgi:RNA polymerase sigma-70 factor (ECF subfamily)